MIKLKYCSQCGNKNRYSEVEGRHRYNCLQCNFIHYENPKPTATLICPQDNKILLVKRALEPAKGQWGLPGGFIEMGESPFEGATRELNEETNLCGIPQKILGTCSHHNTVFGDVLLVGILMTIDKWECMMAQDDAEEAILFDLKELPPLAFRCHEKIIQMYLNTIKDHQGGWCY